MNYIKELRIIKIFFILNILFLLSKEEIINNPIKISDYSNPIILTTSTQYVIYTSGQRITINKEIGEIESTTSFYTYNKPYVLCIDESNNFYIYSYSKNLFQFYPSYSSFSLNSVDFPTSTKYVGYLEEEGTDSASFLDKIGARCKIKENEIVIYGKKENYIIFSYIKGKTDISLSISSNLEDQISCKKLSSCQYICGLIYNNKAYLYLIMYTVKIFLSSSCEIKVIKNEEIPLLTKHTQVTLYDTVTSNIKVICAKNTTNLNIECLFGVIDIKENSDVTTYTYTVSFSFYNIFLSFPTDSSTNEYCKFVVFGNEYLFCCGGNNLIKCSRYESDYNYINEFTLNLKGDNTYISIITTGNYAAIFYMNELDSQSKTYEYYIYLPDCTEKEYIIIIYHSINGNSTGIENSINSFFTRKTNTNYYIEFENIPEEYGKFTIDDNIIDSNNSKILINQSNSNILDFISTNDKSVDNFEILYTISIDETYSTQCKINLTILECYESCKECTKDKSSSNDEEHNCIENNCKEGYYMDPTKSTNCFMVQEKKSNWYFDYIEMKFGICEETCVTCDGPSNKDCLSCYSTDIDPNHAYLYNKECINNCPEGTYKELTSTGYYKCSPCYTNCKTCSVKGDSRNMKCDSCYENNIFYLKNCYEEYDSNSKSFYLPGRTGISSCYELINYYIKENTFECFSPKPNYGYFLSNSSTGVLSPCHEDCKTCSQNYTEDNSNCDICLNQDYNYLDGNCVENCPDGYYTLENSNSDNKKICKNCYNKCLTCINGPIYTNLLVTNMGCINCKKDVDPNDSNILIEKYIQYDGNCFPIILYTQEKIIFNISEINTGEIEKTCYDYGKTIIYGEYHCISKPSNTYYIINNEENTGVIDYCDISCSSCNGAKNMITLDTNCIDCSEGYFKTIDSNTNCILESLIPENYYKNETDNIYYLCYINCKRCNEYFDTNTNNMNCLECIDDYYFLYETNNCYNMDLIQNNEYYFSHDDNKFHKCYYSCEKCLEGSINEENQNCIKCIDNYYFEENTNNCYNMTYIEKGYYFDNFTISEEELPKFKKCHDKCKKCYNKLIDGNMNCELCIIDYYKINGTDNCYNEELLDQGYYLKDNLFFQCEENCLTCSNSKTIINGIESNNCLSCDKTNKGLYLVDDLKNCEPIEYKENGYYLQKDANNIEILYKCYQSCALCEKGKEFDEDTNKDNHNCLECAENYYKLKNDLIPTNCYGDEMISLGYILIRNYWQFCHENCETCIGKPIYNEYNQLISQNCLLCYGDLHFIYQTNNCENDSVLENGYYFDDNDSKYHKCDIQCKKCEKYSTSLNPKCTLCNNEQGYYLAENKSTSNCYNRTTIDDNFLLLNLIDEDGNNYKIWKFVDCYSTCESCLYKGNEIEHKCLSCAPKHYFIYNSTNCITNEYAKANGYYFNTSLGQYVNCDNACITCNGGNIGGNTNCIKCNENEEYYIINGKSNSMCYNSETIEEGYFLNRFQTPYKWNECYETCATCEYKGNSNKMACLSCKTNLISPKYNKVIYFKFSNGNCIEGCPDNLFLTKTGDCVELCPHLTYQFVPNTSCVDTCPENYELNEERTRCVSTIFPETMTVSNFKNIISENISNFVDSNTVINGSNFKAQIISSSDLDPVEQIKKGISGLDLGDCINILKKQYNIPSDEDLIIVELETKEDTNNDEESDDNDCIDLGKNVQVYICDYSGRKLDMSYCNEEITVMKYIGDLEGVDLDSAMKYAEQGIDVFSAKDSFFNDICHPFNSDTDIVIGDRREDLFQNVSFCGDNCVYNGMDFELMIANCGCDPSSIQMSDEDSDISGEDNNKITLNDLANSFTSELLDFNFIVVKCYNLIFNAEILKKNLGFFVFISMNALQIIFLIIFWSKCLKPIKNYMLVYEPFDPNIDPPNPPKINKNLSLTNAINGNHNLFDLVDINTDSNNNLSKKEKEIKKTILINNLLRNKKSPKKEAIKHNKHKIDNDENNDDALIVHYINSDDSSSKNSYYKRRKNNDEDDISSYRRSGSYSERNKKKLSMSINQKIGNKNRSLFFKYDDDDITSENNISSSEDEKNNKNIIINKNAFKNISKEKKSPNKDKEVQSKRSSSILSNYFFSPKQDKTIEGTDIPLSINNKKLNKVSSKFLNSKYNKKKEKGIISEKNEEDEDYNDSFNYYKYKINNNYENIFETININIENKKKRNVNHQTVKYSIKGRNSNYLASNENLITSDDDNLHKIKLKKYLSSHKKKLKNKEQPQKEKHKNKLYKNNKNISSKSVVLTTYKEQNKKDESKLSENIERNKNLGNMRLKNKIINYAYTSEELREMNFEQALHNDNRNYFSIYIAILIEEHIILNTFFTDVYLELRAIKLSFLVFSLEINFFLNALFYTDEYISQTYHNNGVLDFFSSLPKSIYSFIVSIIVVNLLKMLSSSKKQLIKIINERKDKIEYLERTDAELKKLRKKLILYFIAVFILGIFFLYYVSAFCAVYSNSQKYWFFGCLESLAMDFSTPFLISIVLTTLRYLSLRKHIKCLYSVSSFLGNVL